MTPPYLDRVCKHCFQIKPHSQSLGASAWPSGDAPRLWPASPSGRFRLLHPPPRSSDPKGKARCGLGASPRGLVPPCTERQEPELFVAQRVWTSGLRISSCPSQPQPPPQPPDQDGIWLQQAVSQRLPGAPSPPPPSPSRVSVSSVQHPWGGLAPTQRKPPPGSGSSNNAPTRPREGWDRDMQVFEGWGGSHFQSPPHPPFSQARLALPPPLPTHSLSLQPQRQPSSPGQNMSTHGGPAASPMRARA